MAILLSVISICLSVGAILFSLASSLYREERVEEYTERLRPRGEGSAGDFTVDARNNEFFNDDGTTPFKPSL